MKDKHDDELYQDFLDFISQMAEEFTDEEAAAEAYVKNYMDIDYDHLVKSSDVHAILEAVQLTDDPSQRQGLLDRVAQLEPGNLTGQILRYLTGLTPPDDLDEMMALEKAYRKRYHQQLASQNLDSTINWPYCQFVTILIELLIDQLLFKRAENLANRVLDILPEDDLGMRFRLMTIYALTDQPKRAQHVYQQFGGEADDQMMLAMVAPAILGDELAYAQTLIKRLWLKNSAVTFFFQSALGFEEINLETLPLDDKGRMAVDHGRLAFCLSIMSPLYERSSYLYRQVRDILVDLDPQAFTWRRDFFRETAARHDQIFDPIFEGISGNKARILVDAGLGSKEDFADVTRDQVLALDGIGPKTLDQLASNGVIFKDQD